MILVGALCFLGLMVSKPAAGQRSLKEKNTGTLFAALALNVAVFYVLMHAQAIAAGEWVKLATGWMAALPSGVGAAAVALLNSLVDSDTKARLVFFRWKHPYPGSRAFSRLGPRDDRIDMRALEARCGPLPENPKEQNQLWYRMYKSVATAPAVEQAHQLFLLARDYAFASLMLIAIFGGVAAFEMQPRATAWAYVAALISQWGIAVVAANVTGRRFVTNVLAQKCE